MTDNPNWIHVMPIGDLREHESNIRCFCKPTEDEDTPGVLPPKEREWTVDERPSHHTRQRRLAPH